MANKNLINSNDKTEIKSVYVSNEFIDIYMNFNVCSQIENMIKLTKRELYLLLVLCLDKYPDDDPVVINNYQNFKKEVLEIFNIQDDKVSDDPDILLLIEETGDPYIETDNIIDENGNNLPDVLSKDKVRDAKINIIRKD